MLLEVGDGKLRGSKAFPDTFPRVNTAAFGLRALVHKARIAAKHKPSCWSATADKTGRPGGGRDFTRLAKSGNGRISTVGNLLRPSGIPGTENEQSRLCTDRPGKQLGDPQPFVDGKAAKGR